MKIKLFKVGKVRLAALPWDDYQFLCIPISDAKEAQDRWELKVGETVFQIWSARTLWKHTLKGSRCYSVRPDKTRKEILEWIANMWFGEVEPTGPQATEEYFESELWKLAFLEAREPLFG